MSALRLLGVTRAVVGGVSLLGVVTGRAAAGGALPPLGRAAATLLAVRDLAQGGWLALEPRREVADTGVLVDLAHAASMVPVVAVSSRYRRAASISAGTAVAWAVLGSRLRDG